jgi:hypothetical protein
MTANFDERMEKLRRYIARHGGLKSRDPLERFDEAARLMFQMHREEDAAVERMQTALNQIVNKS